MKPTEWKLQTLRVLFYLPHNGVFSVWRPPSDVCLLSVDVVAFSNVVPADISWALPLSSSVAIEVAFSEFAFSSFLYKKRMDCDAEASNWLLAFIVRLHFDYTATFHHPLLKLCSCNKSSKIQQNPSPPIPKLSPIAGTNCQKSQRKELWPYFHAL